MLEIEVTVVGDQWWWEFEHPEYGFNHRERALRSDGPRHDLQIPATGEVPEPPIGTDRTSDVAIWIGLLSAMH